jgi:hypothetical protein
VGAYNVKDYSLLQSPQAAPRICRLESRPPLPVRHASKPYFTVNSNE